LDPTEVAEGDGRAARRPFLGVPDGDATSALSASSIDVLAFA
jgi:hypothetical protein